VAYGYVVLCDEVIGYDQRKETPQGVLRRPVAARLEPRAQWAVNAFFDKHGDPAPMVSGAGQYQVHRGPIGSGEAVVADRDSGIRAYLRQYNDKTLALETEAAGLVQAFGEAKGGRLAAWLQVRGISDLADAEKSDDHHEIAARHAAMAFERLVPYLMAADSV
jgi:adenosylhomocysteine nucleosidase